MKKGLILLLGFFILGVFLVSMVYSDVPMGGECIDCIDSCKAGTLEACECFSACSGDLVAAYEYCISGGEMSCGCFDILEGADCSSPIPDCTSNSDCSGDNNMCVNGNCVSYFYTSNQKTVTTHTVEDLFKYNFLYTRGLTDGPVQYCCFQRIGGGEDQLATCIDTFHDKEIGFEHGVDNGALSTFMSSHWSGDESLAQCFAVNIHRPCNVEFNFNGKNFYNWQHCVDTTLPGCSYGECGYLDEYYCNEGGCLYYGILDGHNLRTYFRDFDGDGRGDPFNSQQALSQPTGYVTDFSDCNDGNANIYYGVEEVCGDGLDNNCDGNIDEGCPGYTYCQDADGDGYGTYVTLTTSLSSPPSGWANCPPLTPYDCNDNHPNIYPGAMEVCGDGIDQDCDNVDRLCGYGEDCTDRPLCASNLDCTWVSQNLDTCQCPTGSSWNGVSCVVPLVPELLWMDQHGTQNLTNNLGAVIKITPANLTAGVYYKVVYNNSGLTTPQTFVIKEEDPTTDDNIVTLAATINGNALEAILTINQSVIDAGMSQIGDEEKSENPPRFEYYFEIDGKKSGIFYVEFGGVCGDGILTAPETCDDGNLLSGDGCSATCAVESGWTCDAATPNDCTLIPTLRWMDELKTETYSTTRDNRLLISGDALPFYVKMVYNNSVLDSGTFSIYEDDPVGRDNLGTRIATHSGTILEAIFEINLTVFEDSRSLLNPETDGYEFYFEINGERSPTLYVEFREVDVPIDDTINFCQDYTTKTTCEGDLHEVAQTDTECYWVESKSECGFRKIIIVDGRTIGSCDYLENTDDSSTCGGENVFMTYSWTADWVWDSESTTYASKIACEAVEDLGNCAQDGTSWFYDPLFSSYDCIDGSATIACPAQIQLDFFNAKNLIAAVLLIIIIYLILKNFKKPIVMKKTNGKKKVVVKKKAVSKKKAARKKK